MKKSFISGIGILSVILCSAIFLSSCKDYFHDVQVENEAAIVGLQNQIDSLVKVIDECKCKTCEDGKDGLTPYIGSNGNWWIGDTDTTVPATGANGITPTIGANGNWWIGDTDTNVPAAGTPGATGATGASAYDIAVANGFVGTEAEWLASLKGANGTNGTNGTDGKYITAITLVTDASTDPATETFTFTFSDGSQITVSADVPWICDEEACENAVKVVSEITNAFIGNDGILTDAELADFGQKVSKALQDIQDALAYINALKKRATSVQVEGVNNNVFGMIKTSADVQTNMLFGFYGSVSQGFNFPTTNAAYYGDNSVLLDNSFVTLNTEEIFAEDIYDTLGTIYYSINPVEIDFTDSLISLVNSQNKTNGLELTPIALSEETLKMGYTGPRHAPSANVYGFYESKAFINDINAVDKLDIPTDDYIALAKAVRNGENRTAALATAVRNTLTIFNTDAYALQVVNADTLAGVDGNEHIVRSALDIQAAVVKPVGYEATAMIPENLRGYTKAVNLTNRVIAVLLNRIQGNGYLNNLKNTIANLSNIQHINFNIQPGSGNAVDTYQSIALNFTINEAVNFTVGINQPITLTDAVTGNTINGTLNTTANGTAQLTYNYNDPVNVHITISEAELAGLYNGINTQANSSMVSVNQMIDDLNNLTADALAILNRLTDDDLTAGAQTTVDNLIDRVWAKLDRVYGALEYRFELALFALDEGKIKFVRSNINAPTQVSSSFTAVMTNLNAEMITPAWRKHLCVTNAFGAADKQAAINAANASINHVYKGSQKTVTVSGLQSGVIYEIAYSGLDYAGKQETRYFYVQCK